MRDETPGSRVNRANLLGNLDNIHAAINEDYNSFLNQQASLATYGDKLLAYYK
jgi:hypothetical protein